VKVALFVTCLVDTFLPRVGVAVTRVLRHFGCEVEFPPGQTCCGQPAFNSGFHDHARAVARRMIRVFEPYEAVVTPSASCGTMVRRHIPELFQDDGAECRAARRLAEKTFEFTQFLRERLNVQMEQHLRFTSPITFHYPCHAREIYSPAALARSLAAAAGEKLRTPQHVDLCCGFGGMFSVDYPGVSGGMLNDKLEQLTATGVQTVICNEGGCTLQIAGGAHRRGTALHCKHIAECLAESLGLME
jgi:L-lactate dehydrogenase complex protein LldE